MLYPGRGQASSEMTHRPPVAFAQHSLQPTPCPLPLYLPELLVVPVHLDVSCLCAFALLLPNLK